MKAWIVGPACFVAGVVVGGFGGWRAGRSSSARLVFASSAVTSGSIAPVSPASAVPVPVDANGPLPSGKLVELRTELEARTPPDAPVRVVKAVVRPGPYNIGERLAITFENATKDRVVIAAEGWAYGFDAFDESANLWAGRHFRGFQDSDEKIAPGKRWESEWSLAGTNATTALAEVAKVRFSDGTIWERAK